MRLCTYSQRLKSISTQTKISNIFWMDINFNQYGNDFTGKNITFNVII